MKCTKCFVIKPVGEFRQRIRKNKSGPKEERVTHCRVCELDASRNRYARRGKTDGE